MQQEEFEKRNKLQERSDLGTTQSGESTRQVVELMCEQIECADILILNKVRRRRPRARGACTRHRLPQPRSPAHQGPLFHVPSLKCRLIS